MGMRHEARVWAVQFLFQRDFNRGDVKEALEVFWKEVEASPKGKKFAEQIVYGVEDNLKAIDTALLKCTEHWDLHRMGAVDRNVMRVALYEMLYCPDIPPVVSINEAVEVAKDLSSYESGRFVNGVLDRALKDLDRPSRKPQGAEKKKEG